MMRETVSTEGLPSDSLLCLPDTGAVRGGIVALHGSSLPQRDQPIFHHLARTLTSLGYVVSTFDRRSAAEGEDTPLDIQARDARQAVRALKDRINAPVGLFGFSQGAWSAALAASGDETVAFLVLVGCSGVSPADQMRFYGDELLRRGGFDSTARAAQLRLRIAIEDALRGTGTWEEAQALLEESRDESWFPVAFESADLPSSEDRWPDMDYDPEPSFTRVTVPTLLLYGADEECVPAEASKEIWSRASQASGNRDITMVDIQDCGHFPAAGESAASLEVPLSAFSPAYTAALHTWFEVLDVSA